MRRRRPTPPKRPTGFTLIELLVVIVILGLLVGLLVPAVMNAVKTARNATVSAEIQAIGQGLAQFKNAFGDFPPSRILVSENGDYSSALITNAADMALAQRSIQYFRKFWPRMQFNTGSATGPAPGITAANYYDVDGSGSLAPTPYILTGPECLVLFLGGVPQQLAGGWGTTGFSKNPTNPFLPAAASSNRVAPFFDFPSNRLVTNVANGAGSPSGFPGFLDSLGSYDVAGNGSIPFYAYFSSYGGVGYDPADCDMAEKDDSTGLAMIGVFTSSNSPRSLASAVAFPGGIQSPAPNPYTNSPPAPTIATGNLNTAVTKPRVWQNAQSYQLISAGADRLFGMGGQYVGSSTTGATAARLPWVDAAGASGYIADSFQTMQANAQATGLTLGGDARAREADNLTNFSQGKLD